MKTILQRNINLNIVTVVHYDVKPSIVFNKLGVKARPDHQTEEGIQFLESRERFDILFDHERGITCFGIETAKLKEGIQRLKSTLSESKLLTVLVDGMSEVDDILLLHNYSSECTEKEFLISHNITTNG